MKLRLGTRGSELARTQSGHVAEALRALGHEVELVTIRSEGDVTTASLRDAGGLGVFAAALRQALLAGQVDLAVHSLKDLPTAAVDGLTLAAIPPRAPVADVLCARDGLTLADLPPGATVGTGSPRRAAQVRAIRPDLVLVEIRGNVATRLARVLRPDGSPGDLDAVVLAQAGLDRLGLGHRITETLGLLPAPGQGALAVECRADDAGTRSALAPLDDPVTRACVTAERAVLAALGAGCAAPVGAQANAVKGDLALVAAVWSTDGQRHLTARATGSADHAAAVGDRAAEELLSSGAGDITSLSASRPSQLDDFHRSELWAPGTHPSLVGRSVLFPRADGALADAVRAAGAQVTAVPLTRQRPLPFTRPDHADWLLLTSPAGVAALTDAGLAPADLADRIAVVGPTTRRAVEATGSRVDLCPDPPGSAAALAARLGPGTGSIVVAGSALAGTDLPATLSTLGWSVHVVSTYTTEPLAEAPLTLREAWPGFDAVVLTAGSVARATLGLLGAPAGHTRVIALGTPTADVARGLGLTVHATSATPDGLGLVQALVTALEEPT